MKGDYEVFYALRQQENKANQSQFWDNQRRVVGEKFPSYRLSTTSG
jgi:hypothetical protein